MMKKTAAIFMAACIALGMSACSSGGEAANQTTESTLAETTTESTTAAVTETTTESTTQTTTAATTASTTKETTTKPTTKTTTKKETTTKKPDANAVFALSYKGKSVKTNTKMKTVLKNIGNPKSAPTKSASCMDTGYDMVYTYSGFELESFCNEKGNETLFLITITGKNVETGMGVKVGMKIKDAVKKCGVKMENEDGVYTYSKGDYAISLFEADGKVEEISIEYDIAK